MCGEEKILFLSLPDFILTPFCGFFGGGGVEFIAHHSNRAV
jgi:hypothetical protein